LNIFVEFTLQGGSKMRLFSSLIVLIGSADVAGAHSLGSGYSLADQLTHQVVGLHHLPMTIFLIAAGVILLRAGYRKAATQNKK
jgi:hypothetical protein